VPDLEDFVIPEAPDCGEDDAVDDTVDDPDEALTSSPRRPVGPGCGGCATGGAGGVGWWALALLSRRRRSSGRRAG